MNQSVSLKLKEGELFFRQWLRSPKSMGSVIPSSQALAKAIAGAVAWQPGQYVVELGGGTGAITQGLLDRGIPRDRMIVIELEEHLHSYLQERLPGSHVIKGDATKLDNILGELGVDNVSTVVSGLPMLGMPFEFHQAIVGQGLKAVADRGHMLQYTYSPVPPVPARKLGIRARLCKYVMWNFPPATVWRYTPRT
ncbi:class I SAM-dependent methyltransferase [Marinimicrococcus flavescens]|uniref:rRNA adenine N-6-methyltransferase family protein n=1 Tax=Marinimicrococcus flavescens TaxID=3031815 RepID=A0AAP3UZ04_9PROT|nr:rRNA adenine N-6-methyltransferase family protein [Marinimicrococcus flavescens]